MGRDNELTYDSISLTILVQTTFIIWVKNLHFISVKASDWFTSYIVPVYHISRIHNILQIECPNTLRN